MATAADEIVSISGAQMSYLLSGIDWRNPPRALASDERGLRVCR